MKKLLLIICLLLPTLVFAQQIFQFRDNSGRLANVAFSGSNLLVEQGGVVKAFYVPPYSGNIYTWVSDDGSNVLFSADMLTMSLYVGVNPIYLRCKQQIQVTIIISNIIIRIVTIIHLLQ